MSDEPRVITDDMLLSELTVGEFKALLAEFLTQTTPQGATKPQIPIDPVPVRRKSLDEFMNDLSGD